MNDIDIHVGSKIRQRRTHLHLSQTELANMIGVSSQQIHKYESGLNRISASMLFSCAKILHTPITYFYEGIKFSKTIENATNDNNLCFDRNAPLAVLLVEDNPVDEMLVRGALEKCDKKTVLHTVYNGVDALQVVRGKKNVETFSRPDIVLLDLNIPKRGGLEVLKEIKQDREVMDIPVIVLTNSINPEDMFKSYKNGASGFMSKSFDIHEFNSNIASVIGCWSQVMVLPSMQY